MTRELSFEADNVLAYEIDEDLKEEHAKRLGDRDNVEILFQDFLESNISEDVKKYDIVILEDLDRFKNISIFTKLRELNSLLNQAQDIGRRIVFVYSLSDSVFEKSIERTKFFDFILPIIPHTNPSNSADQFVKILGELVNGEDDSKGITTYFIKDIAPFIAPLGV